MSEKWFKLELKETWLTMASVVRWLAAAIVVGVLTGTVFGEESWLRQAWGSSELAVVIPTIVVAVVAFFGAFFLIMENSESRYRDPPCEWQWGAGIVLQNQNPIRQVHLYHLLGMLALLPAEVLILPFYLIIRCAMTPVWRKAD